MGTIGIVNATNINLYVITAAGSPPTLKAIANALNGTLTIAQSLNTSVNKGDGGWEKSHPGARNWAISGDCEFAFDADYGFADLEALIQSRALFAIRFSTEESNDYHYQGNVYIESLELSGDAETNLTFSYTLKGTGLLTKQIIADIDDEASASITASGAALSADVNPQDKITTVIFEYGTTTSYGSTKTATQSPLAAGDTAVTCTGTLTGLNADTTYHWRVKVSNDLGTVYGADQTFTTLEA